MSDMQTQDLYRYRVVLSYDDETGQTIAEVPTLDIVDYGADSAEALTSVQEMIVFHLECLLLEGAEIPREESWEEGLYLQVRAPVVAA